MNFVSLYPIECEQTELKNMENPFEEQQNQFQRPTFLLVLCILTFIGSGWGTLSNLFSVFTAGLTDSSMQMEHYSSMLNGMDQGGDSAVLSDILSSTMASLQATFVHAKEIAVINLVLSVISLLGAILMFQLRRIGFYFYTAAQILMLFVLPYFAGFNFMVLAGMLFSAIFAVIFIVMYALNLNICVELGSMKIDASVIQRLSQGDREAYTAVFREYYAPLVVYSSRIVKEREIAEDIVQEFFCYLWKQRRQLAEMHSFTTYLYRSIHNRLLNYLRDRRGIPIEDQDMLKEDDFVGRMMEEEVYRELYDAVRRLPARCRDIFILKLDGADNRDIARQLDITEETVRSQLRRGKEILRRKLTAALGLSLFILICQGRFGKWIDSE